MSDTGWRPVSAFSHIPARMHSRRGCAVGTALGPAASVATRCSKPPGRGTHRRAQRRDWHTTPFEAPVRFWTQAKWMIVSVFGLGIRSPGRSCARSDTDIGHRPGDCPTRPPCKRGEAPLPTWPQSAGVRGDCPISRDALRSGAISVCDTEGK